MGRFLWAGGAVVTAAAAFGAWWAATSPAFWAGLSAIAAGALWKAVGPFLAKLFRSSPETQEAARRALREALPPSMPGRKRGGPRGGGRNG